jgi:hypothetical protein
MKTDLTIARLARDTHSLVTRRQLLDHGVDDYRIDHRVRSGLLIPVHPGVYRLAGLDPFFEQSVLAACLATGGVASGRSAGALFRLRGVQPGTIEITVSDKRAPRLDGVVTHHSRLLQATTIGIIPVTMPAQTLLGLADVVPRLAEGALNDALARGVVTLPRMVRFLNQAGRRGRGGTTRLRELVQDQIIAGAPTESWLEDRLLELIRAHGLPEPVRQFWLPVADGKRIRFDFAYPLRRLDIEADSRLFHSTPADRRRDAARDDAARRAGWAVERVTWLQMEEEPAAVAARIGASLGLVKQAA